MKSHASTRSLYCLLVIVCFLFSPIGMQQADAQLFKKLFKKKNKTERKTTVQADGIDDALQLPLADIATADNANNRNAFMGIPIGIKADRFEQQLLEKGFTERKNEGKQTAKTYAYEGDVYGAPAVVTLAVSEQTARAYAVDVEEPTLYPNVQAVRKRFETLKTELQKVYGPGFADNQGEAYTIQSRLGTVVLHYERSSLSNTYTIGFQLDDAKAYAKAYQEMEDKEYESAPRTIEGGLADACRHTDLVGLGVLLLQNRTLAQAKTILQQYGYAIGKMSARLLPASFAMGDYTASASLARRRQAITAITLTATDDAADVRKDLATYGFTTTDDKTFRQGRMTVILSADKQGRVVLTMK